MAFPLDDQFLGPATFGRRKGSEGIIWHTTEAADASRASALSTAKWQLTNPGSYNFIIYDANSSGSRGGILLTVPYLKASGGVNPASSAWAPERYPELRADLSAEAYADPNSYLFNVAFSGKTAVFRDVGIPDNMIETAQRLTVWAAAMFSRRMAHSGHFMWQTNRSDPSPKILNLITGDDMPIFTRPAREKWRVPVATEFYTGGPEMGERKFFATAIDLWSNGETIDGAWRRLEYHDTATEGEDLWVRRSALTPISGTRNPASGYGEPTMTTGYTQQQLDAAKASSRALGFTAGKAEMHAKAIVEAEEHLTETRALK